MNLLLRAANGDVTVTFTSSTSIEKTSTGTYADITTGSCINATGTEDASGTVTATTASVSPSTNGTCSLGARFGSGVNPGGPFSGGSFGPRAVPSGIASDLSFVRGIVTAASGTSVTVQSTTGTSQTVIVPTAIQVSVSAPGTSADLVEGACVSAAGPKGSSGTVAAQSLDIEPAGPSGCPTGRGSGFGGFGGGGFGSGVSGGGTTGL